MTVSASSHWGLGALTALALFSAPFAPVRLVSAQTRPEPAEITGLLIEFDPAVDVADQAAAERWLTAVGAAVDMPLTYDRPMSGDAHVIDLSQPLTVADAEALSARLAAQPGIRAVQPNYRLRPALTPNDPSYATQWHYAASAGGQYGINAPAAWDITTGSASIVVAVIDTGILTDHPDLAGRLAAGYDMISDTDVSNDGDGRDGNPADPGDWTTANQCFPGSLPDSSSWHGTHVAGTIGAASNNSVGVAGVNWTSPILPVRALGRCGGLVSDIIDAMRWSAGLPVPGVPANTTPARVINMSLGGSGACGALQQQAVNDVIAAGAVLVVAAGNEDQPATLFNPGNCVGVINVTATSRSGGRANYANFGTIVSIAAPGGDSSGGPLENGVFSTYNAGTTSPAGYTYDYLSGTSMAAPHVAGIVSLMLSVRPALRSVDVLAILRQTATPFPTATLACTPTTCGAGIVDAGAAVAAAQSYVAPLRLYLPMVSRTPAAIIGTVASTRASSAGLPVELRVYSRLGGGASSLVASTTASASGQYAFTNVPALGAGLAYFVRVRNPTNNPAFLWMTFSRDVSTLSEGVPLDLGLLDVTGLDLVAPAPNSAVSMPSDFSWARRPTTTDNYHVGVYDPNGAAEDLVTDDLGYVSGARLNPPPGVFGYQPGTPYAWYVGIKMPGGALGWSLPRGIRFNNVGLLALDAAQEAPWRAPADPGRLR